MGVLSPADITKAIAEVARAAEQAAKEGKKTVPKKTLSDGASLSLKIRGGSALWVYKFRDGISFRSTSLGSYHHGMSLSAARNARNAFAAKRYEQRVPRRGLAVINSADPPTEPKNAAPKRVRFADLVETIISLKAAEWKVKSNEPRNYRRLKTGALGRMWVDEINQAAVETELLTRWGDAIANMKKMRGRIETVIGYAIAKELRADGLNPARKEIMDHLLPKAPETVHRPAMRFKDVPALMSDLRADGSPAARALAFAILTVTRNMEARLADWSEVVGDAWIIPGGREERSMKEGQEHAIPLSAAALALLGERKPSGLIFGAMHKSALNDKLATLRPDIDATVHGMRTAFTSWARDAEYPKALRELAKAHAAGLTATEAAYERSEDAGEDRDRQLKALRPMLQAWADYCTGR